MQFAENCASGAAETSLAVSVTVAGREYREYRRAPSNDLSPVRDIGDIDWFDDSAEEVTKRPRWDSPIVRCEEDRLAEDGRVGLLSKIEGIERSRVARVDLDDVREALLRVDYGVDAEDTSQPECRCQDTPDPLENLPVPTTQADSVNVSGQNRGSVVIQAAEGSNAEFELEPGVYDWISIKSGDVEFEPGAYIIRDVNPTTGIALNIAGGEIDAKGVMFYITNSNGYNPIVGLPDALDGNIPPPAMSSATLSPSVLIDIGPDSRFWGLKSANSPFDRMVIYQRRIDRRPIVIVNNSGSADDSFQGTIYAKWGHVILMGGNRFKTRLVAGAVRLINQSQLTIDPSPLLPPVEEVFLVE